LYNGIIVNGKINKKAIDYRFSPTYNLPIISLPKNI